MNKKTGECSLSTLLLVALLTMLRAGPLHADDDLASGRYLVTIGGCNDCHTSMWAESNGKVDEKEWLTGSPIGWRGPWGTTYPSNLRLLVNDMSEDAWVVMLKTRVDRPPMPWMNVNRLSEKDARAMYRFIKSLGAHGERMPTALDPQSEPKTPYFIAEPVFPSAK